MALTRRDIADDFDAVDEQIKDLNDHKSAVLADYRAQLAAEGLGKAEIKLEIEATKAAIKKLRAKAKDAVAVEEKDALVDEIADEIERSRARRTTRVENIEEFPTQPTKSAVQAVAAHEPVVTSSVENDVAEISTPIHEPQSRPTAGSDLTTSPSLNGQVAPLSPETANNVGEAQKVERRSPKPEDAGSIPAADANKIDFRKALRPHCLKPHSCGGMGREHCWSCKKAMNAAGAA